MVGQVTGAGSANNSFNSLVVRFAAASDEVEKKREAFDTIKKCIIGNRPDYCRDDPNMSWNDADALIKKHGDQVGKIEISYLNKTFSFRDHVVLSQRSAGGRGDVINGPPMSVDNYVQLLVDAGLQLH